MNFAFWIRLSFDFIYPFSSPAFYLICNCISLQVKLFLGNNTLVINKSVKCLHLLTLHYTFMIPTRWKTTSSFRTPLLHNTQLYGISFKSQHNTFIQQILYIPWNTFLSVNDPLLSLIHLKTYRYETIFTHFIFFFFHCLYSRPVPEHSNYCWNEIMDFVMALCAPFPGGLWNGKDQPKKEETK